MQRSDSYEAELALACELARNAGLEAMRWYGTAESTRKAGGSPVTEADHASNRVITEGLARAFPDDAVLSEESRDSFARLTAQRVWIVDPLDGTKEFLSQNGEFSIMIGLAIAGEPVLGVIYLPATDVLYSAAAGAGAWRSDAGGEVLLRCDEVKANEGLRLVGSRSHSDPLLVRMQQALGITDVRPCGSVGVKCSLIAEGERDLYIHPVPYMKEWDTCAPEMLIREVGGSVSDCNGEPLRYNKPDPAQPCGMLAAAPGVHDRVRREVAALFRSYGTAAPQASAANQS